MSGLGLPMPHPLTFMFLQQRVVLLRFSLKCLELSWASQVAQRGKNLPANAGDTGDTGSIPGLGRSPEEGNDSPPQYSWLKKSRGQRSLESYSP